MTNLNTGFQPKPGPALHATSPTLTGKRAHDSDGHDDKRIRLGLMTKVSHGFCYLEVSRFRIVRVGQDRWQVGSCGNSVRHNKNS